MSTVVQRGSWPGWPGGVELWLADDAAVSILTAARDFGGVADPIVLPVGAGRTVAECEEMGRAFDIFKGHVQGSMSWALAMYAKYNMDKASNARPSTTSPHVSGYCADIADQRFFQWMIANGARYGWKRTLAGPPSNDERHFQFFPGTATAALDARPFDNGSGSAAQEDDTMPHPLGIVYTLEEPGSGGLTGVKIVVGPQLIVLPPADSVGVTFAGILNHGLERYPDFGGDGQPIPMAKTNADWIAAGYGPQIPGGTIAYLYQKAVASGQPQTFEPTVSAQIDTAALQKSLTDAIAAAVKATAPADVAAIASAVDAALADDFSNIPTAAQNAAATVKAEGAALSHG